MDFDFSAVLDDDLKAHTVVETPTKENSQNEQSQMTTFCTFWRTKSMMSVLYNKDKILFKFMLGKGETPQNNNYLKESKVFFQLNKEELFKLINDISTLIASLKTQNPKQVQLIHEIKEGELKKFDIYPAKDNNSFFVNLKYKNANYSINMNLADMKFFLFALKMILYEIYTGTRVGFTYNWI